MPDRVNDVPDVHAWLPVPLHLYHVAATPLPPALSFGVNVNVVVLVTQFFEPLVYDAVKLMPVVGAIVSMYTTCVLNVSLLGAARLSHEHHEIVYVPLPIPDRVNDVPDVHAWLPVPLHLYHVAVTPLPPALSFGVNVNVVALVTQFFEPLVYDAVNEMPVVGAIVSMYTTCVFNVSLFDTTRLSHEHHDIV